MDKKQGIDKYVFLYSWFIVLQFDVDLAKVVASQQINDDSLQKKLWLNIAKHVIEEEQNINQWVKGGVAVIMWSSISYPAGQWNFSVIVSFLRLKTFCHFSLILLLLINSRQAHVISDTAHVISDRMICFRRQFVNHWRSTTHTLRTLRLKWRWVWLVARCMACC